MATAGSPSGGMSQVGIRAWAIMRGCSVQEKSLGTAMQFRGFGLFLRVACRADQVVGSSTSFFSLAIWRMSSVIFIEQYFGPHMLQK